MATKKKRRGGRTAGGPNKSEFIRGLLTNNPNTSAKDVQAKWVEAGHKEPLNPTLFYLVKGNLGLTKRRAGGARRGRRPNAEIAASAARNNAGGAPGYLEIERALDRLINQAEDLSDRKLAEDLRQARRRASTALI